MRPATAMLIALFACLPRQASAAIANPLMPDSILFITHESADAGNRPWVANLVTQNYGFAARKMGGLFLMTGARSGSPAISDLLANSRVANGRLQGRALTGGAFLSPDLSFDATAIVFAWVEHPDTTETWTNQTCYHIFMVSADGTNLTQLTDGPFNDFDPCFLPNGRIVFVSERRGGQSRKSGWVQPTYTLHSMKVDGSDIVTLSYHEANEMRPSVTNDGTIVYTRWDYIDREDNIAHHPWDCRLDGTYPRSLRGNYPLPWSTMTGSSFTDGRYDRPTAECNLRAIPNSDKFVGLATGYYGESFGDLIMVDPTVPDDNRVSQVTCITTAGQGPTKFADSDVPMPYGTPWPLSTGWFLANKDSSIVLIDSTGHEQTVYASTMGRPIDPIPFRPRTKPPNRMTQTWQGERAGLPDHKRATMGVMSVYLADQPLPAGTKVSAIRILQLIPKTTSITNSPVTGYASEGLCRMSLGTVPVDADGSAYFEAPVGKLIYFQLLDTNGIAVASMRSGTYVHPGEQAACYGCHVDPWKAQPLVNPTAMRRAASPLRPEPGAEANGVAPIDYYRLVKPIFDVKCAPCHQQKGRGPADMSYPALQPYAFYFVSTGCAGSQVNLIGNPYPPDFGGYTNGDIVTPVHGGSRTTPGMFGARFSRMGRALLDSTHRTAGIALEQMRRVSLWLDANSMLLSAYTGVTEQEAGQLVWPDIDYDSLNPTGVEADYPLPCVNGRPGPSWRGQTSRNANQRGIPVVLRGRTLEVENPGLSIARVRVFDAAGRLVIDISQHAAPISIRLPRSGTIYVVTMQGPGGRMIESMRLLAP